MVQDQESAEVEPQVRRILVVDDDASIRRLMVAALKRAGYAFIEAGNGREALEYMRSLRPDVVLLDLMMPILSGWDVLKARTADEELKRIPVIIVSANRDPEIADAITAGVCAFLPKPFDVDVLTALVRSCVSGTLERVGSAE